VVDVRLGTVSATKAALVKFIVFVIDDATNSGNASEMAAIDAFNDSLRENGHWIFACGIGAPNTASMLDGRGESSNIKRASLVLNDTFYTGFWIIDATDRTEAERLALAGSRACNRRVELRPLL
jgi:hypothetical protein